LNKSFSHFQSSFPFGLSEEMMADVGSASGEPDVTATKPQVSAKPPKASLERMVEILKSIVEEVYPAGDEEKSKGIFDYLLLWYTLTVCS